MKLTKYGHACFTVEEQGQKLLVDPGAFTELPGDLTGVIALVYTHGHFDHYTPELHGQIIAANPDVAIYATPDIAPDLTGSIVPEAGVKYTAGNFTLEFYGQNHADKNPPTPNLGVTINDLLTYPGDSLDNAGSQVKVLLAPANGPWMRITETIALIGRAKARLVIPTHDALLSEAGNNVADNYLKPATEKASGAYQRLATGESLVL